MSKRHTSSRRRAYGRRQHDLHERADRRSDRLRADRPWRGGDDVDLDGMRQADSQGGPTFGYAD